MKRRIAFIGLIGILITFTSCVTKAKYQELEAKYKRCSDDLSFITSEKISYENKSKELELTSSLLTTQVEQLRNDTLVLSRKLRQTERDYAKSKRDYDDLLKNFAELNINNNAEVTRLLGDIDKIKAQLDEREMELNRQRDDLEIANSELRDKESKLLELQSILDQKDAEVKALREKVSNALKGFEGSGLNIYEKNGKVYVSMDEKLLFASGSWVVGNEGEKALKELATVLVQDADINVLIEGHTDNVPYRGSGQVKDNWDLSVMRATAVVKSLLKYGKIDPKRISASGRSEYLPVDEENTTEARAKNRRTEIILTPKLDELFQIIESH
ncbi:OmpA family protein [Bacteroidales bacterium OttesenSCG-928-B11]|nr:OmpA family protein [Bacteroidales bacterium OttesenSCG-928-C03]MDL2311628.1 OmpA family protein [Bacteroidales bacterium OttesenSCG-928-B11]MDL2326762.1 OmpA family protein [Bacteroidales bacterium OttesenSCG-928-A14]